MSEREKLVEVMLTAMSEFHSGNFAEAALIVDAQLAALEAAGVRLVPAQPTEHMEREMVTLRGIQDNQGWKDTVDIYRTGVAASPYAKDKPE